ncbi:hypothetical protein BU14_0333s0018 [Porphyra umbilicalis]|uniref:MYND-type domain-containing protein n=1 Tax=Porphyra umbilicalis TaxID=2786 RepID=A0A1X6NYL5_PORUM|nr:hypothetical protein BU14_0333s0018 [Porphyra umbilicalis]|eukprot:OSX73630.1 hypothetical protein BU14_0333s0018 [Porphyra umbilicalis]
MNALRRHPNPVVQHICATLAQLSDTDEVDGVLGDLPRADCHALLSDAGAAAALTVALAGEVRAAVEPCGPAAPPQEVSCGRRRITVEGLSAVVSRATGVCLCGDSTVVPLLLDVLPDVYGMAVGRFEDLLYRPGLGGFFKALDLLVARHLNRAAPMPPSNDRRTPSCAPVPSYATTCERVTVVTRTPLLRGWLLEQLAVVASLVGGPHADDNRLPPPNGLLMLSMVAPRFLLDDPTALDVLVGAAVAVASSTASAMTGARIGGYIRLILEQLALADPPRFRCTAGVGDALEALLRAARASSPTGVVDAEEREALMHLLHALTPSAAAVTASPAAMGWLVSMAALPPDGELNQYASYAAACMALYVCRAVRRGGSSRIPATFDDAAPTWRRLVGIHPHAVAVAVGRSLLDLCSAGGGQSASSTAVPALTPWFPSTFPPPLLTAYETRLGRCWTCGSSYSAANARRVPNKCSGCWVAVFCSPACAAVGWKAGGHKRSCAAWSRFSESLLTRVVSQSLTGDARRITVRRVHHRQAALAMQQEEMDGDWRAWGWPAARARFVEEAGLSLADVVCLVEPASGVVQLLPAAEYAKWPSAVPAEALSKPLEKHGGRVLRVVHRAHPPRIQSFGPRSLGLA